MILDIKVGKPCDHRVRERIQPYLLNGHLYAEVRRKMYSSPGYVLTVNDEERKEAKISRINDYILEIKGITFSNTVFPPDDFYLEYTMFPDLCMKCHRGYREHEPNRQK